MLAEGEKVDPVRDFASSAENLYFLGKKTKSFACFFKRVRCSGKKRKIRQKKAWLVPIFCSGVLLTGWALKKGGERKKGGGEKKEQNLHRFPDTEERR